MHIHRTGEIQTAYRTACARRKKRLVVVLFRSEVPSARSSQSGARFFVILPVAVPNTGYEKFETLPERQDCRPKRSGV